MDARQNPYARAYRARDLRVPSQEYDEMTLNKRAFSTASHFDLSSIPDAFALDDETQNKRLYSRRSMTNINAIPDLFASNNETQNKRAFSSRSQADLRALPDFAYPPRSPASSLSNTSIFSNGSQYSLRSAGSHHHFAPPPGETLNKYARSSESSCDIIQLPNPFSSRSNSEYSLYEPTQRGVKQMSFLPSEEFTNVEIGLDVVSTVPSPASSEYFYNPDQHKAVNKYHLSAESQHDLHQIVDPFESSNPYNRLKPYSRQMRDFSAQSMEDLRVVPSIEDVTTARSFVRSSYH